MRDVFAEADELERVPDVARRAAFRAAMVAMEQSLDGYGLDALALLDVMEWCLADDWAQL